MITEDELKWFKEFEEDRASHEAASLDDVISIINLNVKE